MTSGEAVTNCTLATSENWKDKSGEKQEKTEWHNLSVLPPPCRNRRRVSEERLADLRRGKTANAQMAGQGRQGPLHHRDRGQRNDSCWVESRPAAAASKWWRTNPQRHPAALLLPRQHRRRKAASTISTTIFRSDRSPESGTEGRLIDGLLSMTLSGLQFPTMRPSHPLTLSLQVQPVGRAPCPSLP